MQIEIKNALEVLRKGGIVIFAADTHWCLGCDATNPDAVARLFTIYKSQNPNAITVLFDTENRLPGFFEGIPDVAYQLIEFTEKPLTLILDGAKGMAKQAVNPNDGSIAISITKTNFSKSLIQQFKKPIASIPAAKNEMQLPKMLSEISPDILKSADYVVQFQHENAIKLRSSSIVKIGNNLSVKIIRE